ncbi:MAG: ISAzo13-like element transposase-related protein [Gammaproteobacteria bacterium]
MRVRSELDRGRYPGGVVVSDQQLARIALKPHRFLGDWNYTIEPTSR